MYNKKWTAGLYLLPALVLVTVFIYVAIGLNFYYSLFRWSTYTEKGLGRAEQLCQNVSGPELLDGPDQQFIFCRHIGGMPGGLRAGPGRGIGTEMAEKSGGFCRTIFFIPSLISISVVSLMWQLMLNPSMGFVNRFLKAVGLGNPGH